ncbi:MAG: bifunctional folylpolyglutamate synthase/dihydrofolate synthase [Paludibacteraceae bacterium]
MTYIEAIDYLYNHAPMFQAHGRQAYKSGLDTTLALDAHFGHPHQAYRTIHIAGTNGKGSTSHLLASVLQCAGYKVGLYTSPHLRDFCERIRVDGEPIPHERVAAFVADHRALIDTLQPSFFEITTALAFLYFAEQQVDVAVIEVGLGGRLDCTNIITPVLSVITNISLDHTDILGDTIAKIAVEKAGIIKPDVPVVVGETQPETAPIFVAQAANARAPIIFADQLPRTALPPCALHGNYQAKNLKTVLAAIEQLQQCGFDIAPQAIADGLLQVMERTHLQGRWQTLSEHPRIICDTGHNEGGIRYVVEQLQQQKYNRLHIVFGMVKDKNIDAVLQLLPREATYYFTQAHIPRALDATLLQHQALSFGLRGNAYSDTHEALDAARRAAAPDDLIFVGGSNYVIAEII